MPRFGVSVDREGSMEAAGRRYPFRRSGSFGSVFKLEFLFRTRCGFMSCVIRWRVLNGRFPCSLELRRRKVEGGRWKDRG